MYSCLLRSRRPFVFLSRSPRVVRPWTKSSRYFSTLESSSEKEEKLDELKEKTSVSSKWVEVKQMMRLYQPEKKPLMTSTAALAVSTGITMCVPAGMGKVIDLASAESTAQLPELTLGLGGLFLVGALANVFRINASEMIGERITKRLRQDTYESILDQEMGFYDKNRTGELINRLSADTTVVGNILSTSFSNGLRSTAQGVASISMLFVTCPQLATLMVSIVPPMALGAVSYGRYVKNLTKEVQTKLSSATELAEERLSNIRIVRWFAAEEKEKRAHDQVLSEFLQLAQKRSFANAGFFGAVDLSLKMSMLGVLGYGGRLVAEGAMSVGDLTSFLLYTLYVGTSFAGMSSFYSQLMKGIGASSRIFDLIDRKPEILSRGNLEEFQALEGRVEFKDITFAYPSRPDARVFNGLEFTVNPNETVAVVGPSGCGKSTIIGLLARFYELDRDGCKGAILIDGTDVSHVDPGALRRSIAAVSQEPPLFATSVAENIAYGEKNYTPEDIEQAAKDANAHAFIMRLPQGYATQVGERGATLSGGQKQRIAIARALIRNPNILIMDEATSALDSESEMLVQEAIDRCKHQRTVILISHRLSTIRSADRIIVVDQGRVVQQGNFDELAQEKDGVFAQVVLQQHY